MEPERVTARGVDPAQPSPLEVSLLPSATQECSVTGCLSGAEKDRELDTRGVI